MISVVQRVDQAQVRVAGNVVGQIGRGLLVLTAVERDDEPAQVEWMAQKLTTVRLFPEGDRRYHLDVRQAGGEILLVSNFTVAADTQRGRRPTLEPAADPPKAQLLFDQLVHAVRALGVQTRTGVFGADMKVSSTNDGPSTFLVRTERRSLASAEMAESE